MAEFFAIHTENPQARLIQQASDSIQQGGVVVIPTDSGYALSCALENKRGVEIIRQIRRLDERHHFTLLCRDLSEISVYSRVGNQEYRLLKAPHAGAYTFILEATREVPRRLMHPKRKQIGIRVPDNQIALDLLGYIGEPLMTSSLMLPNEQMPMTDPYEIMEMLGHTLDLVIDGGFCGFEGTTVVDLTRGTAIGDKAGSRRCVCFF